MQVQRERDISLNPKTVTNNGDLKERITLASHGVEGIN
jgi:hypothetical protein